MFPRPGSTPRAKWSPGCPQFVDEFEALLSTNEILMARCQGMGILRPELAVNAGVSGPMLRASGVNYDIRKVDHYGIYDRFNSACRSAITATSTTVTWCAFSKCASPSRFSNRRCREIPAGPIMDPKAKIRGFRPKPGEAYGRIEAPKGELGFYLISDGGPNPYRYRVRPPSLINLTILEDMCLGHNVADVVLIFGSVDIVLGEVDR